MRGAQKLEKLAAGLTHAKTLRLLGAVVGSAAFAGCLMAGKDAYGRVRSVVELLCETYKLVLLWMRCCVPYCGVAFFGVAICVCKASCVMSGDGSELETQRVCIKQHRF